MLGDAEILANQFTFHYVSIKSAFLSSKSLTLTSFTFHYVSIKSDTDGGGGGGVITFTFHYVSIKSYCTDCYTPEIGIYIPLCIY